MARKKKTTEQPKAAIATTARDRLDCRWHARPDKPHEAVAAIVDRLIRTKRREDLKLWRDLFLRGKSSRSDGEPRIGMRARFNVIRNACETLLARVGKQQPRPWLVTVGGNWKLQRRAKSMGRFIEGDFERLHADQMRREALLDSLVYGTGAIKVFAHQDRVAWQRVWCGDLLTHPREEAANHVRTMYQVAFCDREVLANEWPDYKEPIYLSKQIDRSMLSYEAGDEDDDLAMVVEAWRLPSGYDKNGDPVGGRHCITIDGCTLDDEAWTRDDFPFALLHATRDPSRLWGIGYPERLAGLQAEQNALSELASDTARMMTPKYVTLAGSKLTPDETSNEIEFWQCDGPTAPIILSAELNIMQMMQAAAMQRSEMYRIEGISEQSAEGSSPDNLDSGKAKMVHRDIEAERHAELGQRNEQFTVELARLTISTCQEIAADGGGERLVAHAGKSMLRELRFADVDLADNPYHVRVYPVSQLSSTPAGKLAQLNEMLQAGMISPIEARRLYDMPDLERSNDLTFAAKDHADELIEHAIDGNRVAAPRYCDRQYLIEMGWREYSYARMGGAKDEDLVHLLRLIGSADSELKQEAAKQAAAQPPTPPAAQAIPGPQQGPVPPLQVVP